MNIIPSRDREKSVCRKTDSPCPARYPKSSERIRTSIPSITEFEGLLAVDVRDQFEDCEYKCTSRHRRPAVPPSSSIVLNPSSFRWRESCIIIVIIVVVDVILVV